MSTMKTGNFWNNRLTELSRLLITLMRELTTPSLTEDEFNKISSAIDEAQRLLKSIKKQSDRSERG